MFTLFARAAAASGLVLVLAGCESSAHRTSIFRTADLESGTTLITDAKQRVVINVPAVGADGYNTPTRIVCAEPSPDVAQALSDSISAALKVEVAGKGGGSAAFGRSAAESVAQLGERLGTIQLLRDGLYRSCEAYANGAISSTTYAMIVSRYDNTMVTLLMGELAAGAFGRSGALISAAASGAARAGGGAASETAIKDFQEKQKAFEKAEKTHSDEEKILQGLKDEKKPEEKINAQQQKVDAANDARDEAKDKRDLALKVLAGSVGAATSARGLGGQAMGAIQTAKETASAAGSVLQAMHKNFLDDDAKDFTPLVKACVTTLDRAKAVGKVPGNDFGKLAQLTNEVIKKEVALAVLKKGDGSTAAAKMALRDARTNSDNHVTEMKKKLMASGLTELAIICETLVMPQVAAAMKASPDLVKATLERDAAVAKANDAKAKLARAVVTAKLSDDVEKSAKAAKEAARKAESAAKGSTLRARMELCLKSLEKAANQADALKTLEACFEKVP